MAIDNIPPSTPTSPPTAPINPYVIRYFSGPYSFLSNFYIEPDNSHVEREYQALKCARPADRELFRRLDPRRAKLLGQQVELREDWEEVKIPAMEILERQKFNDHKELARRLIGTWRKKLIEGNRWHDTFWGRCYCPLHNGLGRNELGKSLMKVRRELVEIEIKEGRMRY